MDKLAEILADMLRSALAWEETHGRPTPIDRRDDLISKSKAYTLMPPEIKTGDQNNHANASQK